MEARTDAEAKKKVFELLKDIKVAMMATHDGSGKMHSRPMVAQHQEFDGDLWFFSWANSDKIGEIGRDPSVMLGYANPDSQDYVSVTGRAEVVRDAGRAKELWSEPLRTWFPKGADDPNLALIKVHVDSAEYWDSPSSTVLHAYGYVRAVTTGKPPKGGDNEQVRFS